MLYMFRVVSPPIIRCTETVSTASGTSQLLLLPVGIVGGVETAVSTPPDCRHRPMYLITRKAKLVFFNIRYNDTIFMFLTFIKYQTFTKRHPLLVQSLNPIFMVNCFDKAMDFGRDQSVLDFVALSIGKYFLNTAV